MRSTTLVAILTSLLLIVAACGDSGDTTTTRDATTEAPAETVQIGLFLGQTGWISIVADPVLKMMQIQVDELNAAGGLAGKYPVELLVADMQTDPALGAVVAEDLISRGADFLVAPGDMDIDLPGAQVAQSRGIPVISPTAGTATYPATVGDFSFLNTPATFAEAAAYADFAIAEGWNTAYVLEGAGIAYFQALTEAISDRFVTLGGTVVGHDEYEFNAASHAPLATRIANLSPAPDVIFLPANAPDAVVFLRELDRFGSNVPIILSFGSDTPLLMEAGEVLERTPTYIVSLAFPSEGSALATLYDKYEAEYGERPNDVFAAVGGDILPLLDAAVTKAGSIDPTAIRDAFDSLSNIQGATGPITYEGRSRVPKKDLFIVTTDGTSFELVRQFYPDITASEACGGC